MLVFDHLSFPESNVLVYFIMAADPAASAATVDKLSIADKLPCCMGTCSTPLSAKNYSDAVYKHVVTNHIDEVDKALATLADEALKHADPLAFIIKCHATVTLGGGGKERSFFVYCKKGWLPKTLASVLPPAEGLGRSIHSVACAAWLLQQLRTEKNARRTARSATYEFVATVASSMSSHPESESTALQEFFRSL
jgi:hypothetical protein